MKCCYRSLFTDECLSPVQRYVSEGGIVFSSVCNGVCGCVCLFVNTITLEPFELSSWNFYVSKMCSNARTSSKTAGFRFTAAHAWRANPLTGALKSRATDHYTGVRWLVHWPLMGGLLHLVQQGGDWAGPQPAQAPPRCTKCKSPRVGSQCTNFILFYVALQLPLHSKCLTFLTF